MSDEMILFLVLLSIGSFVGLIVFFCWFQEWIRQIYRNRDDNTALMNHLCLKFSGVEKIITKKKKK